MEFNNAISIDSTYPGYFFFKGISLVKLGRFEDAVISYESALNMETENLEYRYAVSKALLSIQQYDQSLKEIKLSISSAASTYLSIMNRSLALENL